MNCRAGAKRSLYQRHMVVTSEPLKGRGLIAQEAGGTQKSVLRWGHQFAPQRPEYTDVIQVFLPCTKSQKRFSLNIRLCKHSTALGSQPSPDSRMRLRPTRSGSDNLYVGGAVRAIRFQSRSVRYSIYAQTNYNNPCCTFVQASVRVLIITWMLTLPKGLALWCINCE